MAKLIIKIEALAYNFSVVSKLCYEKGISLVPVTKCILSNNEVLEKIYEKSKFSISADNQLLGLNNVELPIEKMLLTPSLSDAKSHVAGIDYVYVSEERIVEELVTKKSNIKIIVPIEMGELREGVNIKDIEAYFKGMERYCDNFEGIAANFGCMSGLIPTMTEMNNLVSIKEKIEEIIGKKLSIVSVGGSSCIDLVCDENFPKEINQFRVGEALFLGINPITRKNIDFLRKDTFILKGEIIEIQERDTGISGEFGFDNLGNISDKSRIFNKGVRKLAVIDFGFLAPIFEQIVALEDITILSNSHNNTVIDLTDSVKNWEIGDFIDFYPTYNMLEYTMMSPYIEKVMK